MGTSGSYSGGGGKAGRDLREQVGEWLDGLPMNPPTDNRPIGQNSLRLPISAASRAIGMFQPRGSSSDVGGSSGLGARGGGRRSGGAQRSVVKAARSAGRAAAASYAYGTANRQILSDLGLDYDELRSFNDPLDISRRIIEAACGLNSESTIDHEEQRWVAAKIADWVLNEQEANALPQPDEIARKAIAFIIVEALASETGDLIHGGERPDWITGMLENELREAAEVLSQQAELSIDGVTHAEFTKAIEDGIETLRVIYGVMN